MRPVCHPFARLALLASFALPASAQVIAHPNQVRGTFRFTSSNPDVVAILQGRGLVRLDVAAESTDPALRCSAQGVADDPLHGHYEVTVESSTEGIVYAITPTILLRQCFFRVDPRDSEPVEPEPAPDAIVDFEACAGVIHVFLEDATGAPLVIPGASVGCGSFEPGSNEAWLIVPGGSTVTLVVTYRTGTDPTHDTIVNRFVGATVSVGCDEIVECHQVVPTGDCPDDFLGRIVGEVDVLGAEIVPQGLAGDIQNGRTQVSATQGPLGNGRWDLLQGPRLSGSYELENLVPSSADDGRPYVVSAKVALEVAGKTELLTLPRQHVAVGEGQTVDLGQAFVVDPARVTAELLFVGPSPSARRGRALLSDVATSVHGRLTGWAVGQSRVAAGARAGSELLAASVEGTGTYDDDACRLDGRYELLTGGLYREPSVQRLGRIDLLAHRQEDRSDPDDWYWASASFASSDHGQVEVRPGDEISIPLRACFGQVTVGFHSTDGSFFNPRVAGSGTFDGVDFEGNRRTYLPSTGGYGLPDTQAEAAANGSVKLLAPAGTYALRPHATFLNPGGGTSETDLQQVSLRVGCRQVIAVVPQLVAELSTAPDCAGTAPITVSGSVRGDDEIASITWSANGSVAVDACRPCGRDPDYSITFVPPGGELLEVTVTATDVVGREAAVTTFARFSEEPSAVDLRPSDDPLRVARPGDGTLDVTWGSAAGVSYSLYRGTTDSLRRSRTYDHAAFGACSLGVPRWSGDAGEGNLYFLATTACGFGDASLGRDSSGREIPGAGPRCP